ncbi:MAG: hypothetical protein FJX34_03380, partial [Alphaproteobacteria bacterium]|nr:hypothetical protein [Alphaproteobacteria bacterium]
GGSCSTPIGVHAVVRDEKLELKTILLSHDGQEIFETSSCGKANLEEAGSLGMAVACKVKEEANQLLNTLLISSR